MNNRLFMTGMFGMMLALISANAAFAEQPAIAGQPATGRPGLHDSADVSPDISMMGLVFKGNGSSYSGLEKFGIGGMNIVLGLGSYLHGHWGHGLIITGLDAVGIAGIVYWAVNGGFFGPFDGPGEFLAVWCAGLGGMAVAGTGVLMGFLFPVISGYRPYDDLTARLDDPRNWSAGIVPAIDGDLAIGLFFTAHFR